MPSRTTWYILAPTFAVSGLLLIVGLGGAWYAHQVNRNASDSMGQNLAAAQAVERLVLAVRDLRQNLDRFVDTSNAAHLDGVEASLEKIEFALSRGRSHGDLDADAIEFDQDDFLKRIRQLRDRPADDERYAAARELITQVNDELLTPAENLLGTRQRMASDSSLRDQVVSERIGVGLLLLGVCGAVAGLLLGFGVARGVHRSLVEISVPVRDIAGRLNEVVGPIKISANTDLSELDDMLRVLADKTADVVQRLQKSQQQSVRHEQLAAVGQLAAGLAHELRNPLMSVKLIVQTAAERAGPSLNERDLAVIEDEVMRLEKLLQTFLDFARPPQPARRAVEVGRLIQHTFEVVRPRAAQQDVQLRWSAVDGPLWIEADEDHIQQVFVNLLLNALDELPGGGNLWVDVHHAANSDGNGHAGNRFIMIQVSDDGPGLSDDVVETAFDPFVSTKDTGVGLGLSICRQIVEAHGGNISVLNRPEGGAQFSVQLPLQAERSAAEGEVPAAGATILSSPVH